MRFETFLPKCLLYSVHRNLWEVLALQVRCVVGSLIWQMSAGISHVTGSELARVTRWTSFFIVVLFSPISLHMWQICQLESSWWPVNAAQISSLEYPAALMVQIFACFVGVVLGAIAGLWIYADSFGGAVYGWNEERVKVVQHDVFEYPTVKAQTTLDAPNVPLLVFNTLIFFWVYRMYVLVCCSR